MTFSPFDDLLEEEARKNGSFAAEPDLAAEAEAEAEEAEVAEEDEAEAEPSEEDGA
jgi:hypothetical protein